MRVKLLYGSSLLATGLLAAPAFGSVIYDVPAGITAPPVDDRGWQFAGAWINAGGVAVAPHYFLTAIHIGGAVGSSFFLNGVSYQSVAFNDIAGTDLRLVQVAGTFPTYAPLYHQAPGSEVGQPVSLIGFGHYAQGAPLVTNAIQNGWYWGPDTAKNFAMNTVTNTVALTSIDGAQHLQYTFTPTSNQDEGIYTSGDSGGGMFLNSNGKWRLAGITHAVDTYYAHPGDTSSIPAAVYDPTGLYTIDAKGKYVPATDAQNGYATEIAAYFNPLDQILLPGDVNFNGTVDFTDLMTLARHYGATAAAYSTGDLNGDGTVNLADLLILAHNYGNSIDGSTTTSTTSPALVAGDPAIATVPEPTRGAAILGATIISLARRRRRPRAKWRAIQRVGGAYG